MIFPGISFPPNELNTIPQSPKVNDLINSLIYLPEYGDQILIHNNQIIPYDYYTKSIWSKKKLKSHFQGILRIPNSNYVYISGSDVRSNYGQIFIAKIDSYLSQTDSSNKNRRKKGGIGTNILDSESPRVEDHLINVFKFADKGFFHAGGMDIEGSILVIPLENSKEESRIKFVNVADPKSPSIIKADIIRSKSIGKAGAAALVRLSNGKYICGVWTDSDEVTDDPRLDLYLSATTDINDGFKVNNQFQRQTILWSDFITSTKGDYFFQNIQFFSDKKNNVFLLATENSTKTTPIVSSGSINRAHLMQLKIDLTKSGTELLKDIKIAHVMKKSFSRLVKAYNFRAGSGFYINHRNELSLYAIAHWRTENKSFISIGEFVRSIDKTAKKITSIDHAILELYKHDKFGIRENGGNYAQKDRCLKLYGKNCISQSNLNEIRVQNSKNKGFHKHISSIKGILPKGAKLKVFSSENFGGKSKILSIGTGDYFEISNLKDIKWGDAIESIKTIL